MHTKSGTSDRARSGSDTLTPSDDHERLGRLFSAYQEPMELRRNSQIFEALRNLQPGDFPAVAERARRLDVLKRGALLGPLVTRWFKVDFAGAQAWMLANPKVFNVEPWAKADPEAALETALANPKDRRSAELVRQCLREIYGDDLLAQLARIKSLPAGNLRDQAFEAALTSWSARIPPRHLLRWGKLNLCARGKGHACRSWRPGQKKTRQERSHSVGALVPDLGAGVLGNELVTRLAEKIGGKDREQVLAWLSILPAEFRTAPAIAITRQWAEKEPLAALEWCMANGVDPARDHRSGFNSWQAGVLGEAMAAEPAKTVEWLEALPAGANRDRLLERALRDGLWRAPHEQLFGGADPLALRIFRQLEPDGQISKATELGRKGATTGELTDLDAWARNFSPGRARANAVAGAMEGACKRDASVAETLLVSTTTSADRDAALRGLAQALHEAAPVAAASRALSITNSNTRRETLEKVIGSWLNRDRETASSWLRGSSEIPAAWKQEWLASLESVSPGALRLTILCSRSSPKRGDQMAHFVLHVPCGLERLRNFRSDDLAKAATQAVNGHSHCAVAQAELNGSDRLGVRGCVGVSHGFKAVK
jgi:hypothetical protein